MLWTPNFPVPKEDCLKAIIDISHGQWLEKPPQTYSEPVRLQRLEEGFAGRASEKEIFRSVEKPYILSLWLSPELSESVGPVTTIMWPGQEGSQQDWGGERRWTSPWCAQLLGPSSLEEVLTWGYKCPHLEVSVTHRPRLPGEARTNSLEKVNTHRHCSASGVS